jgi:hypothetical protein
VSGATGRGWSREARTGRVAAREGGSGSPDGRSRPLPAGASCPAFGSRGGLAGSLGGVRAFQPGGVLERRVVVERIEWDGRSSVAIGHGTEEDGGRPIRWAGDWRPMQAIAEALDAGEAPVAIVPDWAVQ